LDDKFIVLLGIDDDLFKRVFGEEENWSCKFLSLSTECSKKVLRASLCNPSILCVVVMDLETHLKTLMRFYNEIHGFIAYFGIIGDYDAPRRLSHAFGLKWRFSAYTDHEYILTPLAKHYLGDGIIGLERTKCNLIGAPEGERMMVPKIPSFIDYLSDKYGTGKVLSGRYSFDDEEIEDARKEYPQYCEDLVDQSPLAMYRNESGGRIAYLGFTNGDGNIPFIVRALLSGKKKTANFLSRTIPSSSPSFTPFYFSDRGNN